MSDPGERVAPASSRVGMVIAGRYHLLRELGEGGIGVVYLAEDLALRMRVAVKVLKREYATEAEIVARFDREAKAMAALSHAHIVQAFNFGRTPEGDIVLVTEFVEGETLRELLGRVRPLPLHGALTIARQLAAALAHAHASGVVHRDLKPENVMIAWGREGRPHAKVLDFGMARILGGVLGGTSPLTRKGAVFGTPEYMPPEQAMGKPVDARADQYALGVMVYEMLAGRRPFQASSPLDMLQLQIHQNPPPLEAYAPSAPPELCAAVARMLSKRAEDRFPDVQSAAAALEASVGDRSSLAGPPPAPSGGMAAGGEAQPRKWWQRFSGAKRE